MPPLRISPRLLPAPLAAEYLAVSVSTLRLLPIPQRTLGSKRLYDARDLDAYADSLPYDGPADGNTCDKLFG